MTQLILTKLFKPVYPYWVVSRVLVLIVGSLIFLALYELTRHFHLRRLSERGELDYVNRIN